MSTLDPRHLRKQIGTILQSSSIFDGSLRDNVAGGDIYTDDEIKHALALAGFEEDLKLMTMGLQTLLSSGLLTISGGQKQRIIIARALIKKPKIFILDEATAALDNLTQEIVSRNLLSLNVTRIVIAHRLSTIQQATRIYVLDKGKIVESGTFAQLMDKRGYFFNSVNKQKFSQN